MNFLSVRSLAISDIVLRLVAPMIFRQLIEVPSSEDHISLQDVKCMRTLCPSPTSLFLS